MIDFSRALADAFDVDPSQETGLVVDTFDDWSVSGPGAAFPTRPCCYCSREGDPVVWTNTAAFAYTVGPDIARAAA